METQSQEMEVHEAVIILNWNGVEHLARFIPSVVQYTPASVDVVVVDNGSSDNSVEFLHVNFERVKVVEFDQNYGFAGGYNRALELLDYEFAVLLNSDVEVTQGWCEPLFDALRADEKIAAVAPKLRSLLERDKFEYAGASGGFIDYLGYPFCRGRILQHVEVDAGQYDDRREVMWVSGAAFAVRRSTFMSVGGFDADFFAHMEEIDLCWRFALAGCRVEVIPQSTVYHLGGGTLNVSSPRKTYYNHRNNLAMLFKCAPPAQRAVVAVVRPVLDFGAALTYLASGQWGAFVAVFRAYRDFLAWHGALAKKRKAIRGERVQESQHIYRSSIILRYLLGRREYENL